MNLPVPAVLAQADKMDLSAFYQAIYPKSMFVRVYLW
jgi:hypothetical protein